MGFERIRRDWRWAKRALALCALAFTASCTLLVGPYPVSRDWPFGADVSEVTLVLQPDDWLPAPPQTIKIVRTKNGAEFYAASPDEDSFGGALAIKHLGSNPRGEVYGYAIPTSDLPDDWEGRKNKSELLMAQRAAASAIFGTVIITRSPDGAHAMSLTFGGPFCPENTVAACTYDTSAAVWALLAAMVPEMTFEDVPIYTIRY